MKEVEEKGTCRSVSIMMKEKRNERRRNTVPVVKNVEAV
jgi:hypothetical protein